MTVHLWIRSETRANERRVGITPHQVGQLLAKGWKVTVEQSPDRVIPIEEYQDKGAQIAPEGSWPDAPREAIVFGLKELSDDGTPLVHRHIMFGHAYKGQPDGKRLLARFKAGGGALYDLEYLVDESGRRVAAFGYWAGYAGAAVSLMAWIAQQEGKICPAVQDYDSSSALIMDLQTRLAMLGAHRPTALIIGAKGRVGSGAAALCQVMGVPATGWDMAETAHGGPFPEILAHDIFINAILARPGTPVFVPASAKTAPRRLSVIGDVACDPDSDFSPIKVYDRVTTWKEPALRVSEAPVLDVMAIDNLPSMLPLESSEDFAEQLFEHIMQLESLETGVWARARSIFDRAIDAL